ncbi:DNA-methyltransferase [Methylovulum psychrotolerans]|uniref:Methyltransferase n=1 Tax=Methylovulum psychrotolerans TaxID=1704499 RepID=A0A1Z4BVC5_9GAMM|nr:site-specific DNA-methyltransferase [Methylovulum psychrotolerans]ASF45251.1 site-specific DNA-methyltransferase [Methylovulum psychrotolerans]
MTNSSFNQVKKILGTPAYENAGVAIYCQDCLKGMQKLPDNLVNLTVTSPPYNIGKEYESFITTEDYIGWCSKWMQEIYRITAENGAFWLNVGYFEVKNKGLAVPISYLLWDKSDFYLLQELVWNYAAGVACKSRFSPRNEKLLWYIKNQQHYTFNLDEVRDPNVKYPNQKKNGKLKCNPLGKNPTDVWQIAKVTSGANRSSKERTAHPAQFPTAMIERVIKSSSNWGELVIDPFIGSGSTAIAALENGRHVIGFEVEEKYIQIARQRIEAYLFDKEMAQAQGDLELMFGI